MPTRHILPTAFMAGANCLQALSLPAKIFDIGSGNGFPGLLMAILDPGHEYNLVESDARKCEFLKHCYHRLELKECARS